MIYIYDSVVVPGKEESFERYGVKYKLEKRHNMGGQIYYSYIHQGMEKILVIPGFVTQFHELEKAITKQTAGKNFETCRKVIRKLVSVEEEDTYPSDTSVTGEMTVIIGQYKDIGVTFDFENGKLAIEQEFEIRQNNVFGNGLVISLIKEEE